MKIIFLTGSLEKGRTGVGDYTRLLASECKRLGHEVQTIALNDLSSKQSGMGNCLVSNAYDCPKY